jgi:hypothetical protein
MHKALNSAGILGAPRRAGAARTLAHAGGLDSVWELTQPLTEPGLIKRVAAFHERELFCVYHCRHQPLRLVGGASLTLEPLHGLTGKESGSQVLI